MASIDFRAEQNLMSAFPTPIGRVFVKDADRINPGLKAEILRREQEAPSRARSNHGGWQSTSDLLSWPIPETQVLTEAIRETIKQVHGVVCNVEGKELTLVLNAWANVSRQGAFHKRHNHVTSHWSGVYYVEAGEANADWPTSGTLDFFDPRERVECVNLPGAPFGTPVSVPPKTGALMIFPGWLYHSVNPYQGPGERISISFNAFFRRIEQIEDELRQRPGSVASPAAGS